MTATAPEPGIIPVTRRADDVPGPPQGCWTYEAYAALPDDGRRYEIIAGVLYMTPAPSFGHQDSVTGISTELRLRIQRAGRGWVLAAPLDVRLPNGTLVQPDVTVVLTANAGSITPAGISGVPDLVVEVASPSTATFDRREKMDTYARAGVPEYWIAGAMAHDIEVFHLHEGAYLSAGVFRNGAFLPCRAIPWLKVTPDQLFA